MSLAFEVIGDRVEPHTAQPTIVFRLRLTEPDGAPVHAVALQCQIRIEPQRRRYRPDEQERLVELFGEPHRWGETLRPFLWTHVGATVNGFVGSTEVDLAVPCTYDMEVASTKYLHAVDEASTVPLVLLFSGTTFTQATSGLAVAPLPWHEQAEHALPVARWREVMEQHFPASAWLMVRRDTLDALGRYKASRGLLTWQQAVERLLEEAGAP